MKEVSLVKKKITKMKIITKKGKRRAKDGKY